MDTTQKIMEYVEIIDGFLSGAIAATVFERQFLKKFKNETEVLPEPVFALLDALFAEIDAFCGDRELSDGDSIDEEALRAKSAVAVERLRRLILLDR
jgi:hypothetical protein